MACTFVIFGASGDLTSRKLIPAIFRLYCQQRLPAGTHVVGCARTEFSHESWRNELRETTQKFLGDSFDANQWDHFAPLISYQPLDIGTVEDFQKLDEHLHQVEPPEGAVTRIYYLATSPNLYASAVANLGAAGMAAEEKGPRRIVIEKPFGTDLRTAKELNHAVHQVFREGQVYRIDHYLGKETVQNLLVLRFANSIFEPIWNRNYIDHVQITVAESLGVEGRGKYYEESGALRDMVQSHILQLLCVMAMEPPAHFDGNSLRDEKVKVLRSVAPPINPNDITARTVRGQYADGFVAGQQARAYRAEKDVNPTSRTETYAALKLEIANWRWSGVPFYIRTGKRMARRVTEIAIEFKRVPHMLFKEQSASDMTPNVLTIRIQPDEGITIRFAAKVPGAANNLRPVRMDFQYGSSFGQAGPDAYERLLFDAMVGDPSLFARRDEVETAWGIVQPILDNWENNFESPALYDAGTWGPYEADMLLARDGRTWRRP